MLRLGLTTVAALALMAATAAAEQSLRVTAGDLNVRTGPGLGYSIIGQVHLNQKYVRIGSSGSWRKMWYDHRTGWVHASYVVEDSAPERRVTASSLNVRTGPGTGYSIVGQAPQNSWWSVVGSSGEWRRIYYRGASRWVHGAYLSSSSGGGGSSGGGSSGTSSAGFVQLPGSGSGFYSYTMPYRRWGRPAMVYGLISAADGWNDDHNFPRIGIGDISLAGGGYFPPHVSHQTGKDVDIRPVASTGYEGPLTIYSGLYSRWRTGHWINTHLRPSMPVILVLFNDTAIWGTTWWSGHHDHHHVRIS